MVDQVKPLKTLDSIWRTIKAASKKCNSLGVNHDEITKAMAEARKQRLIDRARIAEEDAEWETYHGYMT